MCSTQATVLKAHDQTYHGILYPPTDSSLRVLLKHLILITCIELIDTDATKCSSVLTMTHSTICTFSIHLRTGPYMTVHDYSTCVCVIDWINLERGSKCWTQGGQPTPRGGFGGPPGLESKRIPDQRPTWNLWFVFQSFMLCFMMFLRFTVMDCKILKELRTCWGWVLVCSPFGPKTREPMRQSGWFLEGKPRSCASNFAQPAPQWVWLCQYPLWSSVELSSSRCLLLNFPPQHFHLQLSGFNELQS
jgi:hypothetical protein